MRKIKIKRCPFCGGEARLQLTDDEGNWRDESYLEKPYSGIAYGIVHDRSLSTKDCPIATYTEDERMQGIWLYDTPEDAIDAWNTRKPMQNIVERLEAFKGTCATQEHDKKNQGDLNNGDN